VADGVAVVLVRPEQIVCGTAEGVDAVVSAVSFVGHAAMVTLALNGSVPPTTVTCLAPSYAAPPAGAHVRAHVEDRVTAYTAEIETAS
jgi:hypothetical protein